MSNLPEKICILPWISIETSPIGTARPCCLAKDEITYFDKQGYEQKYNLKEHTLEEIYHSRYMQLLRRDFLYGQKPATCQRCWDEEAAGRTSKRINSKIRLKEYYDQIEFNNLNPNTLWFIDLKLGNICNLKCRICGSWSSSKWAQEEIDYAKNDHAKVDLMHFYDKKDQLAYKFLKQGAWPRESIEFWDNLRILLPNIKYLEFTGGEPFLIEQHFDLLRYAVETGDSQHIEIHYNTNGTQFPEAAELWNHFKYVEIAFSIDNIGLRFEYERYGANWVDVQNNIKKFTQMRSDKISTQLCLTVNIQNVYYLPELCDWISTQTFDYVYFNMLHDPQHMCINRMTSEAQELVINKLTNHDFNPKHKAEILRVLQFIKNGEGSDGQDFLQKMRTTDEYRKQSFLNTHPEIARAMGYEVPKTLCLAPWVHTYLNPQTERRMCCASREPAQNFKQYIDTTTGTGKYIPITLEEHWNGDHMKSVRRRMMAGEELPECEVCNSKLLNTDVYRSYFNGMFKHKYSSIWDTTDASGHTTMRPVSWDYRFSNLCNFKCRMCGDMLSSAWESEQRQHNMINWSDPKNNWMLPEVRDQITAFQDSQIEKEFADAVENHQIEEVYWVGGEPLMYEQHWRYMQRIVELGDGKNVYARYNTNLSRINYRGINLYTDILSRLRDWQICASLDGTGRIGEYIRTGLNYQTWVDNFKAGLGIATHRRQMRIDFTLTLPGMFELHKIEQLANELGVDILAKVVFSFSPDIILSPLALPKAVLHSWIDEYLDGGPDSTRLTNSPLRDILIQLKTRPTFQESWPNEWQAALAKGKQRVLQLETIRQGDLTLADILSTRADVNEWYQQIN